MAIIGLRENNYRFINYDDNNLNIPEDTKYITIKELPPKIIEAIKESTFQEVQKILCNYI